MIRVLFVLSLTWALAVKADESPVADQVWLHLLALAGGTSVLTLLFSWVLIKVTLLLAFNKTRSAAYRSQKLNDKK